MTASVQWKYLENWGRSLNAADYHNAGWSTGGAGVDINISYNASLGKNALNLGSGYASVGWVKYNLGGNGSAPAQGTLSFRLYVPGGAANETITIELRDYNQTLMGQIQINPISLIVSILDATGTVKYATPSPLLSFDTPVFFELYVLPSHTSGTITMRINEQLITTQFGLNTDASSIGSIQYLSFGMGGQTNSTSALITDIGFHDTSIAGNPQFYGDNNVQYLSPVANGATVNFTPNGLASNWQNAASIPPSTADFNSSTTIGATDELIVGNLSVLTESVGGIFVVSSANNVSGGLHTYSHQWKGSAGASFGSGAPIMLTSGYLTYGDSPASDPNTGGAWTIAGVNGMTIGYTLAT